MGKGVVAAGGHYRSPAEGGTFPARTAFHWAGAGCPGGARPRARSPGCWAPPPGGWAALPAVQRVLGSRACSAPGAGDVEVVPGGRSGDGGGGRVLRRRAGSPPRTLPRGLLTWGLQDSFPADAASARPSAARFPHHSEPAEHPALLAERSRSQPQQLGGRERPPAAAGRRLGAASRARGAAIWSLGSGRRCGYKGRGLAARPEARKGPGSERGSGCLGVWGEGVCEELWPPGRRNRRLPPLSARNSGAVLTGRSNRKSGGVPRGSPSSYQLFRLGGWRAVCVCVWGGTKTLLDAHIPAARQKCFSHFPFLPPCPSHSRKQSSPHGMDFWTPPRYFRQLLKPESGTDTDRISPLGINTI